MKQTILGLLVVSVLSGCSGFIRIQQAEGFKEVKADMKKVICIAPDMIYFDDWRFNSIDYEKTTLIKDFYLSKLAKFSKAAKMEYEVIDLSKKENVDANTYNLLVPMKADIMQAITSRENPLNRNSGSWATIQKAVFADPTITTPEFSALAEKYGTPYFAWHGIFSAKGKTVSIHTIVDVRKSEVVYNEIKQTGSSMNKRNLLPILHDTFRMIRQ